MKIVYCGFDIFKDCLSSLINAGHEILAIYSFPTDNKHDFHKEVLRIASKNKIKFIVGPINENDLNAFAREGCEMILSAGFAYKIPQCKKIPYRLNIHPAPLPYGRGAWPLVGAILEENKEWGVTIHELSEEWDEGAILDQEKFEIESNESLETLSAKSQIVARKMLLRVTNDLETYWGKRKKQGKGVYWKMPTIDERTIKWEWPVAKIERHVRAFGKHGSRALIGVNTIFVYDVGVWREKHNYSIGESVWKTNNEIIVAAIDGLVCIRFWEEIT